MKAQWLELSASLTFVLWLFRSHLSLLLDFIYLFFLLLFELKKQNLIFLSKGQTSLEFPENNCNSLFLLIDGFIFNIFSFYFIYYLDFFGWYFVLFLFIFILFLFFILFYCLYLFIYINIFVFIFIFSSYFIY